MVAHINQRRVIVIIFVCLLAAIISIWQKVKPSPQSQPAAPVYTLPPERPPEQIRLEWKQGVEGVLAAYDQDQNASKARDALLNLSVTNEEKSAHLELVLAFQAAVDKKPTATSDLQKARQKFSSVLKIE